MTTPRCDACRVCGNDTPATHRSTSPRGYSYCDAHSQWFDEPLPGSERATLAAGSEDGGRP